MMTLLRLSSYSFLLSSRLFLDYVVGIRKFLVLSIATLNAYNTYWFWRNFRDLRDASGKDLWPIPRALFAVFFTHGLFRDVDETLRGQGRSFAWSPDATASWNASS